MNVCNIHSNELICDVTSRLGLPLQRYSHPIIRKYICNYIGFSITTSQHALNRVIDQVIQHGTVLLLNSITNIIHMQNHKKGNSLVGHILGWKLWTYRGKILNLRHYVLGILGIWRNKKKNICYAENKFYCYKGWIFPLVIWSLVRMRPN